MPLDSANAKRRRISSTSLGQLGMIILLVSLSVLFLAASLAVLITNWHAPERHPLPWTAACSTLLLGVVSWQLQSALEALKSNRFTETLRGWRVAGGAALAFLIVQAWNVRVLASVESERATTSLFVFCYDLLVGLHAAHVLGGFVPLTLIHARLARRDYSSSRHDGVTFCVQYWHYLGLVWLLLLGVLAWVG